MIDRLFWCFSAKQIAGRASDNHAQTISGEQVAQRPEQRAVVTQIPQRVSDVNRNESTVVSTFDIERLADVDGCDGAGVTSLEEARQVILKLKLRLRELEDSGVPDSLLHSTLHIRPADVNLPASANPSDKRGSEIVNLGPSPKPTARPSDKGLTDAVDEHSKHQPHPFRTYDKQELVQLLRNTGKPTAAVLLQAVCEEDLSSFPPNLLLDVDPAHVDAVAAAPELAMAMANHSRAGRDGTAAGPGGGVGGSRVMDGSGGGGGPPLLLAAGQQLAVSEAVAPYLRLRLYMMQAWAARPILAHANTAARSLFEVRSDRQLQWMLEAQMQQDTMLAMLLQELLDEMLSAPAERLSPAAAAAIFATTSALVVPGRTSRSSLSRLGAGAGAGMGGSATFPWGDGSEGPVVMLHSLSHFVNTSNPKVFPFVPVRMRGCGYRKRSGEVVPCVVMEFAPDSNQGAFLEHLQRDYTMMGRMSAIITLFTLKGDVLHQNAGSIAYYGYQRARAGSKRGGNHSKGRNHGALELSIGRGADAKTDDRPVMNQLFQLAPPDSLEGMLESMVQGGVWKSILPVPASLAPGSRPPSLPAQVAGPYGGQGATAGLDNFANVMMPGMMQGPDGESILTVDNNMFTAAHVASFKEALGGPVGGGGSVDRQGFEGSFALGRGGVGGAGGSSSSGVCVASLGLGMGYRNLGVAMGLKAVPEQSQEVERVSFPQRSLGLGDVLLGPGARGGGGGGGTAPLSSPLMASSLPPPPPPPPQLPAGVGVDVRRRSLTFFRRSSQGPEVQPDAITRQASKLGSPQPSGGSNTQAHAAPIIPQRMSNHRTPRRSTTFTAAHSTSFAATAITGSHSFVSGGAGPWAVRWGLVPGNSFRAATGVGIANGAGGSASFTAGAGPRVGSAGGGVSSGVGGGGGGGGGGHGSSSRLSRIRRRSVLPLVGADTDALAQSTWGLLGSSTMLDRSLDRTRDVAADSPASIGSRPASSARQLAESMGLPPDRPTGIAAVLVRTPESSMSQEVSGVVAAAALTSSITGPTAFAGGQMSLVSTQEPNSTGTAAAAATAAGGGSFSPFASTSRAAVVRSPWQSASQSVSMSQSQHTGQLHQWRHSQWQTALLSQSQPPPITRDPSNGISLQTGSGPTPPATPETPALITTSTSNPTRAQWIITQSVSPLQHGYLSGGSTSYPANNSGSPFTSQAATLAGGGSTADGGVLLMSPSQPASSPLLDGGMLGRRLQQRLGGSGALSYGGGIQRCTSPLGGRSPSPSAGSFASPQPSAPQHTDSALMSALANGNLMSESGGGGSGARSSVGPPMTMASPAVNGIGAPVVNRLPTRSYSSITDTSPQLPTLPEQRYFDMHDCSSPGGSAGGGVGDEQGTTSGVIGRFGAAGATRSCASSRMRRAPMRQSERSNPNLKIAAIVNSSNAGNSTTNASSSNNAFAMANGAVASAVAIQAGAVPPPPLQLPSATSSVVLYGGGHGNSGFTKSATSFSFGSKAAQHRPLVRMMSFLNTPLQHHPVPQRPSSQRVSGGQEALLDVSSRAATGATPFSNSSSRAPSYTFHHHGAPGGPLGCSSLRRPSFRHANSTVSSSNVLVAGARGLGPGSSRVAVAVSESDTATGLTGLMAAAGGGGGGLLSPCGGTAHKAEDDGVVYHEVTATPFLDPVSKSQVVMIVQTDVTARVRLERRLADVMEAEHKLLENIFPRHVLEHIAHSAAVNAASASQFNLSMLSAMPDPTKTATDHERVTILFADIVGFTSMCKEVPAKEVMRFLNDLYTRFDTLLDIYGVYKVETIGDCYMVAGGLISRDADGFAAVRTGGNTDNLQAWRVLSFAKAMLRDAQRVLLPTTNEPVKMRVGIHTGPVVSGVVGTRMPRFCLFGDTINTASRMESTCPYGRIQVSAATHALVPNEDWETTGGVQVKGKGVMETYLLRQQEPVALPSHITSACMSVPGSAIGGGGSGFAFGHHHHHHHAAGGDNGGSISVRLGLRSGLPAQVSVSMAVPVVPAGGAGSGGLPIRKGVMEGTSLGSSGGAANASFLFNTVQ